MAGVLQHSVYEGGQVERGHVVPGKVPEARIVGAQRAVRPAPRVAPRVALCSEVTVSSRRVLDSWGTCALIKAMTRPKVPVTCTGSVAVAVHDWSA